MMILEKLSGCKVNLLLNILGRRADGFHELETVMQPVGIRDQLTFERSAGGIELTCSDPELPTDKGNLVHRAASAYLEAAGIRDGVRIHLQKNIPSAAGLGGGSGNAAVTLSGLNELFGKPLSTEQLVPIAASLGSDIPFFLQEGPAIGTGRGEKIQTLPHFPALRGKAFFLARPGFGVSTPWAYQNLARFPEALNGRPGRAAELVSVLNREDAPLSRAGFYNSLEAPVLEKYPLLAMYQEFVRENGALATLMSGSGSTTFAITPDLRTAEVLSEKFRAKFGPDGWVAHLPIGGE